MEAKPIYSIAKWRSTFETADSRRHKVLTWVSVPNDLSSNGYHELVSQFEDRAPALYGAWIALVMIASKCCVRGILCTSNAAPFTATKLSFMSHFPSTVFEELLPWAESVGWLETLTEDQAKSLIIKSQTTDDQSSPSDEPADKRQSVELPDQTRPDLTQPNPTTPDPTRPAPSSVVGRSSSLCLDWTGEDVRTEGEKFRKQTNISRSALPTVMLAQLIGFGLSVQNGFLSDMAASFRAGTVRVPRKYIAAAIRTYCDEHQMDAVECVAAVEARLAQVMAKEVSSGA